MNKIKENIEMDEKEGVLMSTEENTEKDIMSKGYGIIPKSIMTDAKISIEAKAIYAYLASYSGAEHKCFPGLQIMLYHLQISEKRFYKYRKELIDNGYIKVLQTRKIEDNKAVRDKNIYILEQKITLKLSEENTENNQYDSFDSVDVQHSQFDSVVQHSRFESVQNECIQNDGDKEINSININSNKNNSNNINIYSQVVEYLNEKANTKYRATSKKTKEKIDARLNEGYTLEDFKTVIDNKVSSWSGTEYELYLRPETLFGPKFEGYLNEKPKYNKFNTTQRTYTTNVTNKAAKEATSFYDAKSDYVPDYKKNYDAKSHNPKGHDNFEISSDMQKFTTNENFANDMERKLLGWDDYEESENPYMN